MGKKKKAELDKQKERFINGAIKKGIDKDVANFVFTKNRTFAQYGFNKKVTQKSIVNCLPDCLFKDLLQEDFIAATMSTELTNTSKLREFVEELKRLNVEIIRPSINKCFADFKAEKNKIFYGLGAVKNVGYEAISNIVKEREKNGKFQSLIDFINRVDAKDVNKLQLEGLVKSGAFDEFDENRNKILNSIPKIIIQIKNINEDKLSNQTSLFENTSDKADDFDYLHAKAGLKSNFYQNLNQVGFYISDHPLSEYNDVFDQLNISSYKDFYDNDEKEASVAGTIMSIQEKKV